MNQIAKFNNSGELRQALAVAYKKEVMNFFGNEKRALEFLSNVMEATRRTPKLLECTADSVIGAFMRVAQLKLMPSGIGGEAYVIPYENKGVLEAQFQLGYQGIVTLLYRAGAKSIVAEIVRKNDVFKIVNGSIQHEVDPLKTRAERGEEVGAYAIIYTQTGGKVEKFMRMDEIISHAKKFSKNYSSKYSSWNPENDPEGWMPRKTVLKQTSKLAPKNEDLNLALSLDNEDSNINNRIEQAQKGSSSLLLGNLTQPNHAKEKGSEGEENQDQGDSTTGTQVID